jgi:hypothetical protein
MQYSRITMQHGMTPQQAQLEQAAKAKQLVTYSRLGALLGFLVMFGGCGVGIAVKVPVLAGIGMALGFVVLIAAAIVGQIGRAMQGRVI